MSGEGEKSELEHLQHDAEHEAAPHRMSVMGYLVILFAVAFLLLLFSYFTQQRSSEVAIEGLTQSSVSAMQSIDDMQQDNKDLRAQTEALTLANAALAAQLKLETENGAALVEANQKDWEIICAMDWLGEIQELYGRKKYANCRAMIEEFEANGLKQLLPSGAQHTYDGSDAPSPAARYQEIYDALF